MDASIDMKVISDGLIIYILIAASLCLRAYAQAWMADRLGDHTPAMAGRLTINPLPHIDLLGTFILPLLFIFYFQPTLTHIFIFLAWAKFVPINPNNFAQPRKHYLYTMLSSTTMGVALMFLGAIVGGLLLRNNSGAGNIAIALISINACYIVLDLIPLPPLPGALMLVQLGWMKEDTFHQISRWGGFALLIAFQFAAVRGFFGMLQGLVSIPPAIVLNFIAG